MIFKAYSSGFLILMGLQISQAQMQREPDETIKIVSFKKIEPVEQVLTKKRFNTHSHLINFVILEYGGSTEEIQQLNVVEKYVRKMPDKIRLLKLTKREAFMQTYRETINSTAETYFLTTISINQITEQPIHRLYEEMSTKQKSLEDINNELAHMNKVKFIILKNNIKQLSKHNYFHGNILLIASNPQFVIDAIEEKVSLLAVHCPSQSTSSINEADAQLIGQSLNKPLIPVIQYDNKAVELKPDIDAETIKKLNATPGVGTYRI